MWWDLSRLVMLGIKLPDIYSKAFFRQEVVEHTLNLTLTRNVENRNHVLSDLSRLVYVGCKIA